MPGPVATLLIAQALQFSAPFTTTATNRLHGNIFGTGRAARSTDVAIMNTSSKTFTLTEAFCDHGGFSTGMFPEQVLPAGASIILGAESHGFMTGVECTVKYKKPRSFKEFEIKIVNPYFGTNWNTGSGNGVTVYQISGQGNNNYVRYVNE